MAANSILDNAADLPVVTTDFADPTMDNLQKVAAKLDGFSLLSLGIWFGTQTQYDALTSDQKISYQLWTVGCGKWFEFHIIPDAVTIGLFGETSFNAAPNFSVPALVGVEAGICAFQSVVFIATPTFVVPTLTGLCNGLFDSLSSNSAPVFSIQNLVGIQDGVGTFGSVITLANPSFVVPALAGNLVGLFESVSFVASPTLSVPTLEGNLAGLFETVTTAASPSFAVPTLIGQEAGLFGTVVTSVNSTFVVPTLVGHRLGVFGSVVTAVTSTFVVPTLVGVSADPTTGTVTIANYEGVTDANSLVTITSPSGYGTYHIVCKTAKTWQITIYGACGGDSGVGGYREVGATHSVAVGESFDVVLGDNGGDFSYDGDSNPIGGLGGFGDATGSPDANDTGGGGGGASTARHTGYTLGAAGGQGGGTTSGAGGIPTVASNNGTSTSGFNDVGKLFAGEGYMVLTIT